MQAFVELSSISIALVVRGRCSRAEGVHGGLVHDLFRVQLNASVTAVSGRGKTKGRELGTRRG